MKLSPTDAALLLASDPQQAFSRALCSIRDAKAHLEVFTGLTHLQLVATAFWRTAQCANEGGEAQTAATPVEPWWSTADLGRFLKVLPSCTADYHLLLCCIETVAAIDFRPPFGALSTRDPFGQPLQVSFNLDCLV